MRYAVRVRRTRAEEATLTVEASSPEDAAERALVTATYSPHTLAWTAREVVDAAEAVSADAEGPEA